MLISDIDLGKLIVELKVVDAKGLEDILGYAKNADLSLAEALVEKEIFSEEKLIQLLSKHLKIPAIELTNINIPDELAKLIPEAVARSQRALVFEKTKSEIKLAMADPSNKEFIEALAKKFDTKVTPYLVTGRDLDNSLKIYRDDIQSSFDKLMEDYGGTVDALPQEIPVAKIADLIIEQAYQDKASDIHIEPDEKHCLVRFRLDGVLHDILRLPKNLHERIVSRIKVLSRLKTDEHLTPQDGKMRLQLDRENLDIRVSIVPIAEGEKVVLRLLSSKSRQYSLADLGMNPTDLAKITNAFTKSFGMILATGPTGSGKTTSIYSILKNLNSRDKNITTIEDPLEYRLQGVNQIQVNPHANLTFASGLRSILRQDPNVIFVGEIRDNDTAAIAINAALTGHLVLSTLHTNDAATAIPRIIDMKVEPFLVASTVNIILAQRLVRSICERCKKPHLVKMTELGKFLPKEVLRKNFGAKTEVKLFKGEGCDACHNSGYAGRIGVFEVIEINNKIRKLISEKRDSETILAQARADGTTTMLEDGLQKCLQGRTTIDEVLRVTKVETL